MTGTQHSDQGKPQPSNLKPHVQIRTTTVYMMQYIIISYLTRYKHAHQVPHMERSKWQSSSTGEMTPCCPPPICSRSASEVNHSSGDAQVTSCHRYLVVFHLFVEQLTVFHTSGLVLALSSMFRFFDLDLHAIARWHPERHKPKGT